MTLDIWNVITWFRIKNLFAALRSFTLIRPWETWQQELERLTSNTHLQKLLGFFAVFLGGSPYNTPSLFSLLIWSDFGKGIWYPLGGMGSVVGGIAQLAKEKGATIYTNQEATKILVTDNKVTGVQTNSQLLPADVVIGATDIPFIETKLLDKRYQSYPSKYWQKKTPSISALMIYVGLKKRYPQLVHHNLYFTKDWKKNFQEIFKDKTLPTNPSFYVSVRSKTDRSIVPTNAEELVILVPIGSRTSYSQTKLFNFTTQVIKTAEQVLDIEIEKNTVVKKVFGPSDFAKELNAYQGTALGLAHTFTQSLWLRPSNVSKKVKGLYYVGQYTNPGVGVPTAIASAQIVAKMIGAAPNHNQSIFKKGSTTYYYSSLFFTGQVKQDVFALYAYVRTIDDIVDSENPDLTQLEKLWQLTQESWEGKSIAEPVVQQFIELAKRKKFSWQWIMAFWTAMRSDLTKKSYKNFSELEKYMYGSAEVIGFMMVRILNLPPAAMKTAALQGKAMQLLNFIRDIDEDEKLGRKYLVYKDGWKKDPLKWNKMVRSYLQKYNHIQREAEAGYRFIPKQFLIPIKTAANMYKMTGRILERNPMIIWEKKVKPKKWQVILEVVKNTLS